MNREYIHAVTLKCADVTTGMDILARAQFWEGASGAKPFQRLRSSGKSPAALLRLIQTMMDEVSPGLSTRGEMTTWWSNGNTGFYKPVFLRAAKMLNPHHIDPQDMMQGDMSRDELPGSVFYASGRLSARNHMSALEAGTFLPTGKPQAMAYQFMSVHALDAIKVHRNRQRLLNENPESVVEENVSQHLDPGGWLSVIKALLRNPGTPAAQELFGWILEQAQKTGYPALVEYIQQTLAGEVPSQKDLAVKYDMTDSRLSQVKDKFFKVISQHLSEDALTEANAPTLFRQLSDQATLHGLMRAPAMVMASESTPLRRAVIKLAHQHPELRAHLLPLLSRR